MKEKPLNIDSTFSPICSERIYCPPHLWKWAGDLYGDGSVTRAVTVTCIFVFITWINTRPRFLFLMNTMSFFPYQRFKYSAFRNWILKPLFISLLLQPAFKSATLSPPSVKYCPFKNFKKQDINFQWLLYEESDPITLLKKNWFVKDSTVARQTWWKRHLNIVRCVMRMYA